MIFMPYRVASETRTAKGLPLEEHIPPTHTEHKKKQLFSNGLRTKIKKTHREPRWPRSVVGGPYFCALKYICKVL